MLKLVKNGSRIFRVLASPMTLCASGKAEEPCFHTFVKGQEIYVTLLFYVTLCYVTLRYYFYICVMIIIIIIIIQTKLSQNFATAVTYFLKARSNEVLVPQRESCPTQ